MRISLECLPYSPCPTVSGPGFPMFQECPVIPLYFSQKILQIHLKTKPDENPAVSPSGCKLGAFHLSAVHRKSCLSVTYFPLAQVSCNPYLHADLSPLVLECWLQEPPCSSPQVSDPSIPLFRLFLLISCSLVWQGMDLPT